MGQKVNPVGLRIGVIRDWSSKWFGGKDYADLLHEDLRIRDYVAKALKDASVSEVFIERVNNKVNVTVHTAKPGMVIGKGGQEVDALRMNLCKLTNKKVHININEIKTPELDAYLVADNIAKQLERRVSFRRAMKQAMTRTLRSGAKGVRATVSGRLGGADIARSESYTEGTVPLHTLRADIDYGFSEAHTTYGRLGVKVWIYKKEILSERNRPSQRTEARSEAGQEVRS